MLTYGSNYSMIKSIKDRKKEKEKKIFMKTDKGQELFEQLRNLRTIIAKEENMPPYIIFADKTLQDMCVKAPLTKEEMLKVAGVGEKKYARYGERFLDAIREYMGDVSKKF